jgi:predicted nucleic acid-binding protein
MKILDAAYLIDYLGGVDATKTYFEHSGGHDEHWIMPAPAYMESVVGFANHANKDVETAIQALEWGEVYEVDRRLCLVGGRIAEQIGPEGPHLDGVDALVAAVGDSLDATVVSDDSDLTHEVTQTVIDSETYL